MEITMQVFARIRKQMIYNIISCVLFEGVKAQQI